MVTRHVTDGKYSQQHEVKLMLSALHSLSEWFRAPPSHIGQPIPEHLRHNFDTENQALLARNSPMLLRKEKACPVCRAVIRDAPIEAWGL